MTDATPVPQSTEQMFAYRMSWTVLLIDPAVDDPAGRTFLTGTFTEYPRAARAAVLTLIRQLYTNPEEDFTLDETAELLPDLEPGWLKSAGTDPELFAPFLTLARQGDWERAFVLYDDSKLSRYAHVQLSILTGQIEVPSPPAPTSTEQTFTLVRHQRQEAIVSLTPLPGEGPEALRERALELQYGASFIDDPDHSADVELDD